LTHQYLSDMTDIVFSFNGTLDSYAGQALTAYWGAPLDSADAAQKACEAGLAMIEAVREMDVVTKSYGMAPFLINVVITTGEVLVGDLGSNQRFHYSILGEAVDLLPRLIRLGQQFKTDVLITEFTQAVIADQFETRLLDDHIVMKGKNRPIAVFELGKWTTQ
jgi:adenylate cyclase